ncbi:hypothetical protein [Maribacter sp. 2307ULW6-5]|uniref:hypothetical protein n=1 Tax=Maribacter sp. 2307ULW6-5 TaxID=3386275 RepID=UPI0039BD276E
MRYVELNSQHDYTHWEDYKLEELRQNYFPATLGKMVMQNEFVRLWQINLLPRERMAFRRLPKKYSWSCSTGGMAVLANVNGRIDLCVFDTQDFGYVDHGGKTVTTDIRNIGETVLHLHILEYL